MAIIFHGLSRLTKDADVWLEPGPSAADWAGRLEFGLRAIPEAYLWDLSTRRRISAEQIEECVEAVGVLRVAGAEGDLDIFRKPNNLALKDFDEAWHESLEMPSEKIRVLDASWLMATKIGTERQVDQNDIFFLEAKLRSDFAPKLRTCTIVEAQALFARYTDHETCRAALTNPLPEVRALAIENLRELDAGQNPFAREMLAELGSGEGSV